MGRSAWPGSAHAKPSEAFNRGGLLGHAPRPVSPRHVFFMDSCHLQVQAGRPGPTALCVSSCPDEQLDTLEEVQLFANRSGRHRAWGWGRAPPGAGAAVG